MQRLDRLEFLAKGLEDRAPAISVGDVVVGATSACHQPPERYTTIRRARRVAGRVATARVRPEARWPAPRSAGRRADPAGPLQIAGSRECSKTTEASERSRSGRHALASRCSREPSPCIGNRAAGTRASAPLLADALREKQSREVPSSSLVQLLLSDKPGHAEPDLSGAQNRASRREQGSRAAARKRRPTYAALPAFTSSRRASAALGLGEAIAPPGRP